MMDRALTQIQAADPGAIIFVYGDHGTFAARGVKLPRNHATVVRDRYGTLAAVFNADRCLPFIEAGGGGRFHTTAQIARGIAQCVTPGHASPVPDVDYGRITQLSGKERFEWYVYE
jgi:hypothetical protein